MPSQVTSVPGETFEDVAFLSDVLLSTLHLVLERPDLPRALLQKVFGTKRRAGHLGRVKRTGRPG